MSERAFDDVEIFFTAVLGLAGVLLGHGLLVHLVEASSELPTGSALVARLAPVSTIRPFSVFFVFLPVGLAFLGVGLPFALRTVLHTVRREITRRQALGLVGLLAGGIALVGEVVAGSAGFASLTAICALALWQAWEPLGGAGRRQRFRLLAVAGVCLLALCYYEYSYVAGGEPSIALAPTFLVAGFFIGLTGLVIAAAGAFSIDGTGKAATVLCWLLATLWYAAPALRRASGTPQSADHVELLVTAFAASAITAVCAYHRLRD